MSADIGVVLRFELGLCRLQIAVRPMPSRRKLAASPVFLNGEWPLIQAVRTRRGGDPHQVRGTRQSLAPQPEGNRTERDMQRSVSTFARMASAILMLAGSAAQASPVSGARAAEVSGEPNAIEQIAIQQHCWMHNGVRHCGHAGEHIGQSTAGANPATAQPAGPSSQPALGSGKWWSSHGVP